ncbi:P-loop ATPase, Sll1717 family [Lachnoclostridium sp. MSJ-17]|uniref:P-loop ATPase, Sll1717 family n=1 Tax=Lachnoclostridium sp. MSJ-17 TaxID=2841516 RepID=UPI001C11ADD5|nr:hypothetical protein [Lachnoclostridium sp. MSJ-17]MBU5461233.1 hypothetical protein [Lachnoclostridium sp. MSJ-17]
MGKIQIKDFILGKTDAYNEFLSFGKDICKHLFFEFPNIDINSLLEGKVYYICGEKGSGKTMLLKYIETILHDKEEPVFTSFIRFKKDVDDEQRNIIKRTGTTIDNEGTSSEETIDRVLPVDSSINCIRAWQLYLIKNIVFNLEKTEYGVFERNATWNNLCALLHATYGNNHSKRTTHTIIPKIKRGNVELNIASIAKISFDLEWSDPEKKCISFKSLADTVIQFFSELSPIEDSIYVFVDELELSLKKCKQYERDIILIRDLVFAIQYLSETCIEKGFNVYFIAAIRNEVYKAVQSMGTEINKPIHDFGIQISWLQKGGDIRDNPLLQMLKKRIAVSEQNKNVESSKDIWKTYFAQEISNKKIYNYIINQTWNKPRDIIRLFSIIQKQFGEESFIDQRVFDAVKQQYSSESWEELVEALNANYTDKEIEGIRHVLTGISLPFSSKEFEDRIEKMSDSFFEVECLKKRKASHIIRDLYDVGVIGNYGRFPRFVFFGDRDIDPLTKVTIHYPLINFFRASMNYSRSK